MAFAAHLPVDMLKFDAGLFTIGCRYCRPTGVV